MADTIKKSPAIRVLSVEPRDFWIVFELSLTQIKQILDAMEVARMEYDFSNKVLNEAVEYLTKGFVPALAALEEEIKHDS